jgi:transcriptional regulator with XRE-family HTH domain
MPSETVASFGEVIAAERKREKWSLRELAEKVINEDGAPVSPQYLNDIEHGRRIPADFVIEQLAKALHVPKDVLFHLAGRLAPDIPSSKLASRATIERAYQAFRKSLKNP